MKKVFTTLKVIAAGVFGLEHKPKVTGPGDYCLVGNIVKEHKSGNSNKMFHGTKHFTSGTKVYCLPPQWGDGYESAIVVGICRKSRRWITVVIPTKCITNWRAKAVYSPGVLKRLNGGFESFNRQWQSRKIIEEMAASLHRSLKTKLR